KEKQIDLAGEKRADQFGGRGALLRYAGQALHLFGKDYLLRGTRKYAAPFGDQLCVVIGPGGARQLEQAPAFGKPGLRIRRGIEKKVTVVECGDEPGLLGAKHRVAEHVARHVSDPYAGEGVGLDVASELPEMPLDGFPGAARRNAHFLVVIALATARGEGVAEPEASAQCNVVGDVGEARGTLVGRDDKIRVVIIVTKHVDGRDDGAVGRDIV